MGMVKHAQHRFHVGQALTALCSGAAIFLFGCLIGWQTEPVPGVPGGVAWLSWPILLMMVGAAVTPLVTAHRAVQHQSQPDARSELAGVQTESLRWTVREVAPRETRSADIVGGALELFPQEKLGA